MAVIGPGAQQAVVSDVKPLLDGASEFEYVTILNPLSDDFAVRVAQDVPVNMPQTIRAGTGAVRDENTLLSVYGDTFKNPDFQGRKHIVNDTIIKSGQTINLKGNEAQVAIRQLVNEIMQRDGKQRLLSDPTLRSEVEARIIINRGSIQDLMDSNLQSTRSQLDAAISKSNEVEDEPAFPGLSNSPVQEESAGVGVASDTDTVSEKRNPGRPKKA